jgi:flagellin
MALSINTNIASLQAQNNLSQVNQSLQQNQERLSSGLRINSAADDAAGLAISDRMTAQVRGMNQAARNANDGISMAQTAEGGLQEITNILQRMRQLAVQSANETNTASDRASINQEFQDLNSELSRIAKSTQFNGSSVLNGAGIAEFQVGPNTGSENKITIDMSQKMTSDAIGGRAYETLEMASDSATAMAAGDLEINGTAIDPTASENTASHGGGKTSAYAIANAINNNNDVSTQAEALNAEKTTTNKTVTGDATSYTLAVNGVNITSAYDVSSSGSLQADELVSKINEVSATTHVTAEETSSGIQLTSDQGRNIEIDETAAGGTSTTGLQGSLTGSGTTDSIIERGALRLSHEQRITVNATGNSVGNYFDDISSASGSHTIDVSFLDSADVNSVSDSEAAINKIDQAINDVDEFRATLGAAQNRFESTIANLENASQNLTEARSRIQDADIAKEAAEMTQNNVRRQAASAVLTQANQQPQLALQLLGG